MASSSHRTNNVRLGVKALCFVLLGASICIGSRAVSSDQEEDDGYDHLKALGHFVDAIYPDLAHHGLATLTMTASFDDGGFNMATMSIELHPCRESGVSMEKKPVHYCGESVRPGDRPFLGATVKFRPDKERPIFAFNAAGTFVSEQVETIRDEFKEKLYAEDESRDKQRYWTTQDALEVLRSKKPSYGPENKTALLKWLPFREIRQFTGCKLRPESAQFEVKRSPDILPKTVPPRLEWVVRGVVPAIEKMKEEKCSASFEPFEGNLTSFEVTLP